MVCVTCGNDLQDPLICRDRPLDLTELEKVVTEQRKVSGSVQLKRMGRVLKTLDQHVKIGAWKWMGARWGPEK